MNTHTFPQTSRILSPGVPDMELSGLRTLTEGFTPSKKFPVLFIGHGTPMNALFDNTFTQSLESLGRDLERPNAILVISAHWETPGTYVSTNAHPKTIYDFGGFDRQLYEIKYEPDGAPHVAKELIDQVKSTQVREDAGMGLDHGAWTVLRHIFPKADIPVLEMSMDYTQPPSFHFALGQELRKLREKGVLILCSGNIVHNLRLMNWSDINAEPTAWTGEFDSLIKKHIDSRDFGSLVDYEKMGTAARLSIPTNEHYLPMLYSLGLAEQDEPIEYLYEGYQYGTLSMRCFRIG